jgi:hypothetical protein
MLTAGTDFTPGAKVRLVVDHAVFLLPIGNMSEALLLNNVNEQIKENEKLQIKTQQKIDTAAGNSKGNKKTRADAVLVLAKLTADFAELTKKRIELEAIIAGAREWEEGQAADRAKAEAFRQSAEGVFTNIIKAAKRSDKVEKILETAAKEGKSLVDLMFTVHVQESLPAVLNAIVSTQPIHMSETQHSRWNEIAASHPYRADNVLPLKPYSTRPNTAFDQLLAIAVAVTGVDLALYDTTDCQHLVEAFEKLRNTDE